MKIFKPIRKLTSEQKKSYFGGKRYLKVLNRWINAKSNFRKNVYISSILKTLTNKKNDKYAFKKGVLTLNFPENFSLIENPVDSLKVIINLAHATTYKNKLREIHFNHNHITNMDLSAESILACVAEELKNDMHFKSLKCKPKGVFPEDERHRRLIRSVGVIKSFDVNKHYLNTAERENIEIFTARSKKKKGNTQPMEPDRKARVIKEFTDHLNRCLNHYNKELTPEGRNKFGLYTGEIIDNAEAHSGGGKENTEWRIVGYLDSTESDSHICEVIIFNFGNTISDSLNNVDSNGLTYKNWIHPFLKTHSGNISANLTKENLLTYLALQGGVSSRNIKASDTRGRGTIDLLSFFFQISDYLTGHGDKSAKMAILSGDTHIYFDGTYKIKKDSNGLELIALNDENDIMKTPDHNYIKKIPDDITFPGTIIAVKFKLPSDQYTREIIK